MPHTGDDWSVAKLGALEGSIVTTHRGEYMVISGKFPDESTIIFRKHATHSNVWVYRRTISGRIDPLPAVTGHVLSTWDEVDIFNELEKRLAGREKAYWQLIDENMKLKAQLRERKRRSKKRG